MQSSSTRESYGEILPDTVINQYSFPGFSPEQIQSWTKLIRIAIDQAFERHLSPHQSSISSIQSITQPVTQQITQQSSNLLAKKKRNLRTRNQKKKKAQAQVLQVTMVHVQEVNQSHVQEVNQSHVQEVDYAPKVRVCVKKTPSNHMVLKRLVQWDRMCTSLHAVIQSDRMTMVAGIMIDYGVNQIRRLGVG